MAIKQLDLNLLPIVVALYDDLSVSRTARRLGVSQPAASRALRRLREAFDDPRPHLERLHSLTPDVVAALPPFDVTCDVSTYIGEDRR